MSNIQKDKKYHFIYKTTNLINEKFYIGMHSTSNLNDGYIGSGKRLKRSIKKYGIENFKFEILEYCDTRELLVEKEKYIVNQEMIDNVLCLNLKIGGEGGFTSDQAKLGREAANKILELKYGLDYKSIISSKWRLYESFEDKQNRIERISKALKGRLGTFKNKCHSEESKNNISLAKKGKGIKEDNSQYNTCWVNNGKQYLKISKSLLSNYIDNGWSSGRAGYKNTIKKLS